MSIDEVINSLISEYIKEGKAKICSVNDYNKLKADVEFIKTVVNRAIHNADSLESIASMSIMDVPLVKSIMAPGFAAHRKKLIASNLTSRFNVIKHEASQNGFYFANDNGNFNNFCLALSEKIVSYSYIATKIESSAKTKLNKPLTSVLEGGIKIAGKGLKSVYGVVAMPISVTANLLKMKWILASINLAVIVYLSDVLIFKDIHYNAQKNSLDYYGIMMTKRTDNAINSAVTFFD